jgi:hypothetical protein
LLVLLGAGLTARLVAPGAAAGDSDRDLATSLLVLGTFAGSVGLATLARWWVAVPWLLFAALWTVGGVVAERLGESGATDFWWWPEVTVVTGGAACIGALLGMLLGAAGRRLARAA